MCQGSRVLSCFILVVNDYYLKHFIPEAMSRCMSDLFILLFPCYKEGNQSETVTDLVEEWEKSNISEKEPILESVQLNFCPKVIS